MGYWRSLEGTPGSGEPRRPVWELELLGLPYPPGQAVRRGPVFEVGGEREVLGAERVFYPYVYERGTGRGVSVKSQLSDLRRLYRESYGGYVLSAPYADSYPVRGAFHKRVGGRALVERLCKGDVVGVSRLSVCYETVTDLMGLLDSLATAGVRLVSFREGSLHWQGCRKLYRALSLSLMKEIKRSTRTRTQRDLMVREVYRGGFKVTRNAWGFEHVDGLRWGSESCRALMGRLWSLWNSGVEWSEFAGLVNELGWCHPAGGLLSNQSLSCALRRECQLRELETEIARRGCADREWFGEVPPYYLDALMWDRTYERLSAEGHAYDRGVVRDYLEVAEIRLLEVDRRRGRRRSGV